MMKKKLLLGLLPALLVLSSCQAAPKVSPKASLDNIIEDTEAHDEIFGESKLVGDLRVRKTYDGEVEVPEEGEPSALSLGIQTKINDKGTVDESDDEISIRFVGAIKVEDENSDSLVNEEDLALTSAAWVRTIFKDDGTVSKASAIKECSKAYTSLAAPNDIENDGVDDNILTIEEFNAGKTGRAYTHFVVFTLLDIPLATYGNYYVVVDLATNEGEANPNYSMELATTIDQITQFTFVPYINAHPLNNHYFAVKQTATGFETIDAEETPGSGNLAKFETLALNSGENFVVVHRVVHELGSSDDIFEVIGYDFLVRNNPDFGRVGDSDLLSVTHNGTYNIFFKSASEKIEIEKKIYFQGPDWWEGDSAKAMINLKHDDGGSGEFKPFEMTSTGYAHQYFAFFDISYYTHCEFYRGVGETGYDWSGMKDVPLTGQVLFNYSENTWYNV